MDDETILRDIDISGRRAPSGPDEQQQYYRLINDGLLRRISVQRMPGDTGDPLLVELTHLCKQRLHGRR